MEPDEARRPVNASSSIDKTVSNSVLPSVGIVGNGGNNQEDEKPGEALLGATVTLTENLPDESAAQNSASPSVPNNTSNTVLQTNLTISPSPGMTSVTEERQDPDQSATLLEQSVTNAEITINDHAILPATAGKKRAAETETPSQDDVNLTPDPGQNAVDRDDHVPKRIRTESVAAAASHTPPESTENVESRAEMPTVDIAPPPMHDESRAKTSNVNIAPPPMQDESRVKEDDVDKLEHGDEKPVDDQSSTLKCDTQNSNNDEVRGSNVASSHSNEIDSQVSDDPEDERPLDLASMNAFEYERVVTTNPEALRRYEQYRRSDLKNNKVKRILQTLNPSLAKVNEPYIIAVKGLAKMFVGDVTEMAICIRKERGDKGALQPAHVREAYRRLRLAGVFPDLHERLASFL